MIPYYMNNIIVYRRNILKTYSHDEWGKDGPAEIPKDVWFWSDHAFDVPCKSVDSIKPGDSNRFPETNPQQGQSRSSIKVHDLE